MSPGAGTGPGHSQEQGSRAPRQPRLTSGGPDPRVGPPVIKTGAVFSLNDQEWDVVPLD
jgi:hypothetical protein